MSDPFRKQYQPLSKEQQSLITDLKDQAGELLDIIHQVSKTHDVRACRLAQTKLEECVMWATKAATWTPDS